MYKVRSMVRDNKAEQMDQERDEIRGVRIPPEQLSPETLTAVIEEFITREGTDYGKTDIAFEHKIESVRRQIEAGKALILFDEATQSCNILSRNDPRVRGIERDR